MVGMLRRDARFPPFQTWMPTTVLPTHHTKFETALQYGEEREVVAWRLHVRDISADGVPPTFLRGPSVLDWRGHFLRFTALWSHEMKRTSATREQGYHSWAGEHAVLAVPNVPIGPGGVPECDVEVALCARVAGRPDEVIGSAILTIDRPSHVHVDVELLPQDAVSGAVELPTVSLHIEVASLTREQADRQWGGDGNAATGMMSSQQLRTATQRSAHQTTQAAMQPTTQPTLQPQESPHSSIPVGEASDQEDTQSQQPPLSPTSRGETSGEEVAKPEGSHGNEAAWAATESRSTMYSSSTTGLLTPVASVAGGPSERGERQVSVHASANVQRSAVMGVQTGGGVRPVVGVGEADSRCRDRAEIEVDGRCRDRAEIEADSRCRDAKALSLLVEGRGGGRERVGGMGTGTLAHTTPLLHVVPASVPLQGHPQASPDAHPHAYRAGVLHTPKPSGQRELTDPTSTRRACRRCRWSRWLRRAARRAARDEADADGGARRHNHRVWQGCRAAAATTAASCEDCCESQGC